MAHEDCSGCKHSIAYDYCSEHGCVSAQDGTELKTIPLPHCFDCKHADGIWCFKYCDVQTETFLRCKEDVQNIY